MDKELCIEIGGIPILLSSDLPLAYLVKESYPNFSTSKNPQLRIYIRQKDKTIFGGKIIFQVKKRYDIVKEKGSLQFITYPDRCKNKNSHILKLSQNHKEAVLYLPDLKSYKNRIAFDYPLDQLLMMSLLSRRKGVLLHASGILCNGNAVLFPGLSGAGKTTISKVLHKNGFPILSDDRIIIRHIRNKFLAFGTPWSGAGNFFLAQSAPVKRIFFLAHGRKNTILPLSKMEALQKLFTCVFIPFWDKPATQGAMDLFIRLLDSLACFELAFLPNDSVIPFLKKTIDENS